MSRSRNAGFVALSIAALSTAPLQGQSWTAVGSPNNISAGSQFWDNTSSDGRKCNVGYVLTGQAGTAANPCANQRPLGWLPYSGPVPTHYLNSSTGGAQKFLFGSGTFFISLLTGNLPGGDIAGMNGEWGYFDLAGRVRHNLNGAALPPSVTISGTWGLYVGLVGGGYAYSDLHKQFAVFATNASTAITPGAVSQVTLTDRYIVGLEDIDVGLWGGSDKDYQDVLFSITTTTTPEPGTYLLVGSGLLLVLGASRLRRRAT